MTISDRRAPAPDHLAAVVLEALLAETPHLVTRDELVTLLSGDRPDDGAVGEAITQLLRDGVIRDVAGTLQPTRPVRRARELKL